MGKRVATWLAGVFLLYFVLVVAARLKWLSLSGAEQGTRSQNRGARDKFWSGFLLRSVFACPLLTQGGSTVWDARHETLQARCSLLGLGGVLSCGEASRWSHPYHMYFARADRESENCKDTARARSGWHYTNRVSGGRDNGGSPPRDQSGCTIGKAGCASAARREISGQGC